MVANLLDQQAVSHVVFLNLDDESPPLIESERALVTPFTFQLFKMQRFQRIESSFRLDHAHYLEKRINHTSVEFARAFLTLIEMQEFSSFE
jgi:hypothetical protein